MNQGPPIFEEDSNLNVDTYVGYHSSFKLPKVVDPDSNDQYNIKVLLNEALTFTTFDANTGILLFKPD